MSDPAAMELRHVWGAAPRRRSPRRKGQVVSVVVHHSAGRRPVDDAAAFETVRAIQRHHQDGKGWTDVAYNYVVTPSGRLLEGRGAEFQNGANTSQGRLSNRNTVSICLLGNFETGDVLTSAEKATIRSVCAHFGVPAVPHGALSATACPGADVRDWLAAGMPVGGAFSSAAGPAGVAAAFDEARAAFVRLGKELGL